MKLPKRYALVHYLWEVRSDPGRGVRGVGSAIIETADRMEAEAMIRAFLVRSMALIEIRSFKPIGDAGTQVLSRAVAGFACLDEMP